jgi:hypothetical protein
MLVADRSAILAYHTATFAEQKATLKTDARINSQPRRADIVSAGGGNHRLEVSELP